MIELKLVTIIDTNGYITNRCVDKNKVKTYDIAVPICNNYDILKPKWNGSEWVESATEEEVKAWQEKNKKEEDLQITEEQQLLSTVLLENAEIKEQLKEQQELIAIIMLQNAQLKGGNTNV